MRMLITSTIVAASLALAGGSAFAADANVHTSAKAVPAHVAKTHAAHAVAHTAARQPHYAAAPYGYRTPYRYDYGGAYGQSWFGGWPFSGEPPHFAARGGRRSSGSPSFDSGPSIDESSTSPDFSAGRAASEMANQAIIDNSAPAASAAAAQAISDAQQIINNSAN